MDMFTWKMDDGEMELSKNDNDLNLDSELDLAGSNFYSTNNKQDSLNFRGLVITDAMNMGGVVNVPDCGLKAIQAGCDVLLMPVNEQKDIDAILSLMLKEIDFKLQVYSSVKKVIRLKICLGLIKL